MELSLFYLDYVLSIRSIECFINNSTMAKQRLSSMLIDLQRLPSNLTTNITILDLLPYFAFKLTVD